MLQLHSPVTPLMLPKCNLIYHCALTNAQCLKNMQQQKMSPEEIMALLADASAKFLPVLGNPKGDDLTALRKVLTPLLLSIPYDKDGMAPLHNLISIIELPAM